jgi:hypothetical protein
LLDNARMGQCGKVYNGERANISSTKAETAAMAILFLSLRCFSTLRRSVMYSKS